MGGNLRWLIIAVGLIALIVGPFLLWGPAIESWATQVLANSQSRPFIGALIVGLLAADVVIPVPSSILSVIAGTVFDWRIAAPLVWAGMTLGCVLGYALGAAAVQGGARSFIGDAEFERARRVAGTAGPAMLIFARAVPVLAEASTIAAGAARMHFATFFISTSAANAAIALAYTAVGATAAASGSFVLVFVGLTLVPAIGYAVVQGARRRSA